MDTPESADYTWKNSLIKDVLILSTFRSPLATCVCLAPVAVIADGYHQLRMQWSCSNLSNHTRVYLFMKDCLRALAQGQSCLFTGDSILWLEFDFIQDRFGDVM